MAGDPTVAAEWCVKAAERAAGDVAFEAAARSYERALGALELVTEPDLALQTDIEIARTEMLRNAGDDGFRVAGTAAAATAQRLNDDVRLARAVLAMDRLSAPSATDANDEVMVLVREALDKLGPQPSALRADLLCMKSAGLYWSAHRVERIEAGLAAFDMAREVGDAASMARVLSRSWTFLDAPKPYMADVSDYSLQNLAIAQPGTAPYMSALENLSAGSAVRGDTTSALDWLEQFAEMARDARLSAAIFRAKAQSAFLAVHVGEIERAEAEASELIESANQHAMAETAIAAYGAIIYNVRRAQGRAGELVPLLEGLVESQPNLPVWRVALAGACYFAGRSDVVGDQVAWLAADRCARVPIDGEYPVTLCGLGRLSPYSDLDANTCEFIYDTLTPFAGTMNYTGTSISDANDIALACLADHLGRHDVADAHYRDAIALADRARAVPFAAHYRYEWARALNDRGEPERARPLLVEVATHAEGRDMHGPDGYVAWSADLLARIS